MSENKSKKANEKIFEMQKRNGGIAKFRFVKEGRVWYWDMLHKRSEQDKKLGIVKSLPLPDVNLDKCNTLKDCFDAIAKYRGSDWVGQIYADVMAS